MQENEEKQEKKAEIKETGSLDLDESRAHHRIKLITIIGEIEGHDAVSGSTKATKYEHLLPMLADIEDSCEIDGLLILLNTLGGDVEAGLSIAEMIASLSKPTVSLVLGGSHSIGGPLAVAADYSFIVPSGTMIIHPVRSNGMFIGVEQSFRNMVKTQDRITAFLSKHSHMTQDQIEELMLNPTQLVKDVGTMLEGKRAAGKKVLVVGGGMVGCETAAFLGEQNHEVTVIEFRDTVGADVIHEHRVYLMKDFEEYGIGQITGAKVCRFFEDGEHHEARGYDSVALSMGYRNYNSLEEQVKAIVPDTYVIGDRIRARRALDATKEAYDVASQI